MASIQLNRTAEKNADNQNSDSCVCCVDSAKVKPANNACAETANLYMELMNLEDCVGIIPSFEPFDCAICFNAIEIGEGLNIRNCLHQFCKDCIRDTINYSDDADIKCPFSDGNYECNSLLQDREIRAILTADEFDKYQMRTLRIAECATRNAVHCKLVDCDGWCICEDNVNAFNCPKCNSKNCVSCQAIHNAKNCKEYQDDMKFGDLDENQRTKLCLEDIVNNNLGMKCPECQIVIMKRDGCDWLQCPMCKTEICWITKQRRWGPNGNGDLSGGCKCKQNNKKCHPMCGNCH